MKYIYIIIFTLSPLFVVAQTEIDGIMMDKNLFCTGIVYENSSWNKYWEGNFRRENLNLGTVSTQSLSLMGNYGVSSKLNIIFSLPYVKTNATAGTMKGQQGIQDLSMTFKYMPVEKTFGNTVLSFYALGGFSIPTTNYVADYLPLSIGMQSKTASLRIMTDCQNGDFFSTLSLAYIKKAAIFIDRDSYLTNEINYTNKVNMPDALSFNARFGYRTGRLIIEAIFDNSVTQSGGFDITTNNMPFPSNTMNRSKVGVNSKYTFKNKPELSLVGGYNKVVEGRNIGQSEAIYGGVFYILNFTKTQKTEQNEK
jgi:hypothetical protein